MELPKFKYHPDPIGTGSIKESDETCERCGKKTGYVYNSTIYAQDEIEFICPWCIANGEAAEKFDGLFSDDYPLVQAGLDESVIEEVTKRTPGAMGSGLAFCLVCDKFDRWHDHFDWNIRGRFTM